MDSINAHIAKFAVFLDANVIYKSHIRDLLLRCAEQDTFKVYWSSDVEQEVTRALQGKLQKEQIERLFSTMRAAFPDSVVSGYEQFIDGIVLPDVDDRHIVAAAMRAHCDVILTENSKDFPEDELANYDIEAQHPDVFLIHHYTLEPQKTIHVIREHILDMNKPPVDFAEYLDRLRNNGAAGFAEQLFVDGVDKMVDLPHSRR